MPDAVLRLRFEESRPRADFRLGRHQERDPRSLAYIAEEELKPLPIKPAEHPTPIPTLDQSHLHVQGLHVDGDPDSLGSCTGNAGTYALAALVGSAKLNAIRLDGFTLSDVDTTANERFAIELYHEASVDDGFPGDWPPADEGSSGLGVCKALKAAKLISRYYWALGVPGVGLMLQQGGAIIGTPWLNAFFEPDADGFIDSDPNWPNSGVAGGHELFVEALESWDDRDPAKCVVRFHNSWSNGWGVKGCGRMRLSTYVAMKDQIDWKAFRP